MTWLNPLLQICQLLALSFLIFVLRDLQQTANKLKEHLESEISVTVNPVTWED